MDCSLLDRTTQEPHRLQRWLHRQADRRLDRFRKDLAGLSARVVDVNGPRGGVDQRASVTVTGRDGSCLLARAQASSPEAALALALRRVGRMLARQRARRARG